MPFPTSSFVRDGKYILLQQQPIGSGGLGQIYHANEVALNREVAIKEIVPSMRGEQWELAVEKLIHEATIHGPLQHPHIVSARAFETDPLSGEHYLVCDYVAGGSLAAYLKGRRLSEPTAIALTLELLDALEYLHRHGIVHRDIKPSNILVRHDQQRGVHLLLTDFGIARRLRDAPSTIGTGDQPSLTPEYCAPEQRLPSQLPDIRSDLYAVGLVLGEMLDGGGPYKLRQRQIAPRRWHNWQPRHQAIVPQTSTRLARIIDRATEVEAARRFQTAAAYSAALRTMHGRHIAPARLGLALATLSIMILVAGLALVAGLLFFSPQLAPSVQPTAIIAVSNPNAQSVLFDYQPGMTPSPLARHGGPQSTTHIVALDRIANPLATQTTHPTTQAASPKVAATRPISRQTATAQIVITPSPLATSSAVPLPALKLAPGDPQLPANTGSASPPPSTATNIVPW